MGGCIGSSYCLSLIKEAPDRVSAAVLQNPIGLHENREAFREMFDGWAKALQRHDREPDRRCADDLSRTHVRGRLRLFGDARFRPQLHDIR